jgi:16S rRNA (uracil1498-N3)-methyltransferase
MEWAEAEPAGPAGPRLALALISFSRFDWAVEKAAELGAGEIRPLVCERVKPGLARVAPARVERWRRLAQEARKQCGRPRPLIISPPQTTAEFLAAGPEGFFLSPAAEGLAAPKAVAAGAAPWLLVGPEGGFSPGEEAAFLAAGLKPWRLGLLTLRSETAALAALALLWGSGSV